MPHGFFSFFARIIEKLVVWCISIKENYYNLTRNGRKFQASVTERCISLSKRSGMLRGNLLKVHVKKLNVSKDFTRNELLHK